MDIFNVQYTYLTEIRKVYMEGKKINYLMLT